MMGARATHAESESAGSANVSIIANCDPVGIRDMRNVNSRVNVLCAVMVLLTGLSPVGIAWADGMPPLAAAIDKNDLANVTLLLEQGADPDTMWGGYTMLTWAAAGGKLAIVKALVAHHAKVNPEVSNGFTPLAAAASNRQPAIAAYLIAHGAKVNVQRSGGWTPLDDAEAMHDATTTKLLRAHGGTSGLPPLLGAVNRGELTTVQQLLTSGSDPNSHDGRGATALYIAANVGSLAITKAFVEHHADINVANANGWTPLMEATVNGHKAVVAYLIAHGADLNAQNSGGLTALDIALKGKHADLAALLRSSGAKSASELTEAMCADFRHWADMGATTGYDSLAAGPAAPGSLGDTMGLRSANISIGGGGCDVSVDGKTLDCYWNKWNKNYTGLDQYQDIVTLAKTCSGNSKVVSRGGKTTIWYNRVSGKILLINISGTDTDMLVSFGGARPL